MNRAHNQIDAVGLHGTVEERPGPRVRRHAGAELKIHLVPPLTQIPHLTLWLALTKTRAWSSAGMPCRIALKLESEICSLLCRAWQEERLTPLQKACAFYFQLEFEL